MSELTLKKSLSPAQTKNKTLKKFMPYIEGNKKLSLLLLECNDFQTSIEKTKNHINNAGRFSVKKIKNVKKKVEREIDDKVFKNQYETYVKKFGKIEKFSNPQSLVKSLVKTKAQFSSPDSEIIEKNNSEKHLVNYEQMQSSEVRELLKHNKRKFGDHFNENFKIPSRGNKYQNLKIAINSIPKSVKDILPNSNRAGGQSSLAKSPLSQKDLISFLNEKRKVSQMIKVEKIMHERVGKLK